MDHHILYWKLCAFRVLSSYLKKGSVIFCTRSKMQPQDLGWWPSSLSNFFLASWGLESFLKIETDLYTPTRLQELGLSNQHWVFWTWHKPQEWVVQLRCANTEQNGKPVWLKSHQGTSKQVLNDCWSFDSPPQRRVFKVKFERYNSIWREAKQ